jgi:chemotaxis response regulator CheB
MVSAASGNADGSGALAEIRAEGGRVIVQHPGTAEAPSMPTSALITGQVDHVVPLDRIAAAIVAMVTSARGESEERRIAKAGGLEPRPAE